MRLNRLSGLLAGCLAGLVLAETLPAQDIRQPVESRSLAPAERAAAAHRERVLVFATGIIDPRNERLTVDTYDLRQPPAGHYGLVQMNGLSAGAMQRLRRAGVEILAYQPNDAYLVAWSPRLREHLEQMPEVRWAGEFRAEMKLAPELLDPASAPLSELRGEAGHAVEILGFAGVDPDALRLALRKHVPDARLLAVYDRTAHPAVEAWVPPAALPGLVEHLAALAEVYRIGPAVQPELYNRDSVEVIQADTGVSAPGLPVVTPIWDQGLIGTGQIVTVMDTGLDRNEDWFVGYDDGSGENIAITDAESPVPPATGTVHPDRKVFGYWVQPGATAYDNNEACTLFGSAYHGTHVSGSAIGDSGTRSTPDTPNYDDGDGMAPNAQMLFQDIGNDTSGCLSITDFGASLQQAFDGGARIHSNSWGADVNGAYNPNSGELDHVTWLNEQMLVFVAAGNSGPGSQTIGAPASAKNAVTVGYLLHGDSTTANFSSSRGPTADGRHKPDIQAPGTSIRSASGDSNNGGSVEPPVTKSLSGTSMATPIVAGGTALARQYFSDGFYPTGARNAADAYAPSGALLKAVLLNGTNLDDFPIFDNTYGWGRMWLDHNLYFDGDSRYLRHWDVAHAGGVATGETDTYTVDVVAGEELRVTLSWFDVAGAVGTGITLVNDLDLTVTAPGGSVYRGNVFSGDESATGGSADALNTVEAVRLTEPAAGTWTITVDGSAVPGNGINYSDRQGYALVLSAATPPDGTPGAPGAATATDNGAAGIDITFGSVSGAAGYNVYRATGDCAVDSGLDYRLVGHTDTTDFTDNRVIGGFQYSYVMRAENGTREGPQSGCDSGAVATSTASCGLLPDFDQNSVTASDADGDQCAIELAWDAGASNCPLGPDVRYNVYRSTDPFFTPVPGNRVASDLAGVTNFLDTDIQPETTYYYVVRAEDSTDPEDGNETIGTRVVKAVSVGDTSAPGTFVDDPDAVSLLQVGDPWSISDDRAATGQLSYRSAADGAAEYTPNTCAAVTSPVIDLQSAGAPQLSFEAFYDIEADWDGVVLEISTNDGGDWSVLTPDGGYPGDFSQTQDPPINACGYPASQGAYNGTSGGFQTETVDLSAFAGESVRVRWVFSTDPGAQFEGFYIDDVAITDASTPEACFATDLLFADGFEAGK